ncbi:hypothetical protein ACFQH2_02340 [Natronoarchaeum sp. GCM10025703]|uniref:hypothetical protein n=1 Tax=Natronoarchaeum sp. GCM10025703 TaxID=3252685 RepID=UPI0036188FB3
MRADLREGVDRRRHHWSVTGVVTAVLVLAGLGSLHLLWEAGPTGSYVVGVVGGQSSCWRRRGGRFGLPGAKSGRNRSRSRRG